MLNQLTQQLPQSDLPRSRRDFCRTGAFGLAPVALAWLLKQDDVLAAPVKPNIHGQDISLTRRVTHFEPQAKAMISLFMQGGPSQGHHTAGPRLRHATPVIAVQCSAHLIVQSIASIIVLLDT